MSRAEDRRVRKTREALHASFASLVLSKGYDALTIEDVIADADVGRTTFYSHFRGKADLLRAGLDRLRGELEQGQATMPGEPFAFIAPLFDHVGRYAGLYRALLSGSGGKLARDEVCAVIGRLVEREADALDWGGGQDREAVIAFISGGLVHALEYWAVSGRRSEGEAFLRAAKRAAAAVLAAAHTG